MALIPVQLPPGMFKNATPYQKVGRWVDGNLVRWRDRVVQSIGGWASRFVTGTEGVVDARPLYEEVENIYDGGDPFPLVPLEVIDGGGVDDLVVTPLIENMTNECIRDIYMWRSNSQDQHMVLGTNKRLIHVSQLDAITDITPSSANQSGKDPTTVAGYGRNPYSFGAYGVANDLVAQDPLPPQRWAFSEYGEYLLYLQRGFGAMFYITPSGLSPTEITNAPSEAVDLTVTDQRIVMTVGGLNAPRRVAWSDQEDFNDWTPDVTNQSGSQTLTGVGKLMRAVPVLGQTLILGEADAHIASYIGAPFVFGFRLIGKNCGPYCPEAVLGTERFVAWWGKTAFWLYDGTLQAVDCEVMEFLETDVNQAMVTKIFTMSIHQYNEVWWFYQSRSSQTGEVDSYVIWNYKTKTWNCGKLDRTAGIDAGVTRFPLMSSPDAQLYTHEQPGTTPRGDVYVETGPLDIAHGQVNLAIAAMYPDTAEFGQVTVTAIAKQLPTDREIEFGPYDYNNPTDMRAIGREIRLRYRLAPDAQRLTVGDMRLDVKETGTGRR